MTADQNFDGRAALFAKNIYQTAKGEIRTAVLWRDIEQALPQNTSLRILDAGGGFGFFSQRLAAMGHNVVLCDLSADMLALAKEQSSNQPWANSIEFVHAAFQQLTATTHGTFDFIMCHAVAEWLADPIASLSLLLPMVKPTGLLSLMFYNRDGQRFHNLVSGNFDYVKNNLQTKKTVRLTPPNPLTLDEITNWLTQRQFTVEKVSGIRVIHDFLKHKDRNQVDLQKLVQMELEYSQQSPYKLLGRYLHVLARPVTAEVLPEK